MSLRLSGFTLVRNGVRFEYPFEESLRSLARVCDQVVVNVGKGDDDTLTRVQRLAAELGPERFDIFESLWPLDDPEKKKSGLILSEQTNLALDRCLHDWALYLQADEVLHEADTDKIKEAAEEGESRGDIEGLLFDYRHFYGSYDVVQHTRSAYRREVRGVKRSTGVRSVGDAQSFRKQDGQKLRVLHTGAKIFHYGWVRTPEKMREKTFFMDQLYHGDPTAADRSTGRPHSGDNYRYKKIIGLKPFDETHPAVMQERISAKNWKWDLASSELIWSVKDIKKVLLDFIERLTGIRLFEYRSYRLVGFSRSARSSRK